MVMYLFYNSHRDSPHRHRVRSCSGVQVFRYQMHDMKSVRPQEQRLARGLR
jgi:hypothetical protein